MSPQQIKAACLAVCRTGKFETGQGTCAPLCMEFLGDPRKSGCGHAVTVHCNLVRLVVDALEAE